MTDVPTAKWRSVTASAPAKVILHGEHSVVYGKLALAASIDLRTKVIIKLSSCKKRSLRVNLLNYSKKSLDFDLQVCKFGTHTLISAKHFLQKINLPFKEKIERSHRPDVFWYWKSINYIFELL